MAGADSAAKYVSDDFDPGDRGVRDNAEAARQLVRKIQRHRILSAEWFGLVEQLRKLARLCQLETKTPGATGVLETAGRDSASAGTLWDQEKNETVVRILVEEAKVNLCLRIMNEYKVWQDSAAKDQLVQEVAEELHLMPPHVEAKCQSFEECMGMLLTRAFEHVETLQLIDTPLLLEHIAYVLGNPSGRPLLPKMQETVVFSDFNSMMKHAESLNNAEVLARTRELRLVPLVTQLLVENEAALEMGVLNAGCYGLSALCGNEDFMGMMVDFLGECKSQFLEIEEKIVSRLLAESADKRRELRPLLDVFQRVKRSM